jgi:hypothetical protein
MGRFYGPLSVLLAALLSCRAVVFPAPLSCTAGGRASKASCRSDAPVDVTDLRALGILAYAHRIDVNRSAQNRRRYVSKSFTNWSQSLNPSERATRS